MKYLDQNNDENKTIIEIKHDWEIQQSKNHKKKFKRIAIPIACCIAIGSIYVGNAIYQDKRRDKAIEFRNNYINEQNKHSQKTVSKAEAYIESMKIKLATEEQYHKVLDGEVTLYNEVTYTEDVKTINLLGFLDWTWKNENVVIYGYADAYFEYGTNLSSLKFEETGENEVTAYIAPAYFNKKASHRIAGTYTPHPEKSNKTSRDAKRKAQLEMQFEGYTDSKNNISQRAMINWEDKYDENIEASIYDVHSEDGTLNSLDKTTEDVIADLLNTLSTDKDVKVTVKIDKTLK